MLQFAGFSAESLCERIMDSQCCLLITAGKNCLILNCLLVIINMFSLPTKMQHIPLPIDSKLWIINGIEIIF